MNMEPQGLTDGQKQRPWWAQISRWSAGRSSDQLLSFVNLSPLIIPGADKTSKAKGPLVIIRDHQLAASSGSKWLCRKWDAKICLRLFQGSHIRSVCLASLFLQPGPVWSCQPLRIRRFHRSTLKVHAPSSPKFGRGRKARIRRIVQSARPPSRNGSRPTFGRKVERMAKFAGLPHRQRKSGRRSLTRRKEKPEDVDLADIDDFNWKMQRTR